MSEKKYFQLILPLKLEWEPWYCSDIELPAGRRVKVTFAGKEYVGVVHRTSQIPGIDPSKILPVNGILDNMADISPEEIRLWEFISSYYLCTIGEVYREAYPAMKTRSEEIPLHEMGRLQERIRRIDGELLARQSSNRAKAEVTERLIHERQELLDRLQLLQNRNAKIPDSPHKESGKPTLLWSCNRTDAYLKAIESSDGDVLILSPDHISSDALEKTLALPCSVRVDGRQTARQRRLVSEELRCGCGNHIVFGTRIALFLPFRRLGLVIVDEEQDSLYKQEDPAPRYNARDCALILSRIHKADIILGTSSPSLDSMYNCFSGKFNLSEDRRGGKTEISVIDVGEEKRKHGMQGCLSYKLIEEVKRWSGPVALIRGWEKEDELHSLSKLIFPDKAVGIMTYRQARETDLSGVLTAIVQADALVRQDDFKADEKGMQMISILSSRCGRLVIQTAVAKRFDGSRSIKELMEERRQFGFPPFTRLVETRLRGHSEPLRMYFLKKDSTLASEKEKIRKEAAADVIIDVDPA